MFGLFAALVVTVGLILLAVPLMRRLERMRAGGDRGIPLELIQRIPTGPRQGVALLRVAERVLVVSLSERGTAVLTELDQESAARAVRLAQSERGDGAQSRAFASPTSFRAMMAKVMPALLLLVSATTLAAQTAAPARPAPSAQAPTVQGPADKVVPISPTSPKPAPRGPTPTVGGAPIKGPTVQGPETPKIDFRIGEGDEQVRLSGSVGLVVFMGALTLLPAMFLLMTSFTRILIVLHFLRSALGTQTTPPGQLLVALAVLLTGVVMHPVLERANTTAFQPYMNGQITQADAYKEGLVPFREFMLANVRESDLAAFTEMTGAQDADSIEAVPTVTIVAAFVTSELRTAFQMGFVIFLPFIVVDLIVASVLMSMGMFMLPPAMISLPFKLLLFVLADGWTLVVRNLVASFQGAGA